MYEDLVKRLRERATWINFPHHGEEFPTEDAKLMMDAANSIEELQQTTEHYKGCADDWYREACDYKAMIPRWIPVTERLPEDGKDILAVQSCGEEVRIVPANYDRGVWFDCIFNHPAEHITHWMPLPDPPKEDM